VPASDSSSVGGCLWVSGSGPGMASGSPPPTDGFRLCLSAAPCPGTMLADFPSLSVTQIADILPTQQPRVCPVVACLSKNQYEGRSVDKSVERPRDIWATSDSALSVSNHVKEQTEAKKDKRLVDHVRLYVCVCACVCVARTSGLGRAGACFAGSCMLPT
jgi:hypothetical protein